MIAAHISNSRKRRLDKNYLINGLIETRSLFGLQTIEYDLTVVCSLDLDPTGNFILVGLSNGSVDLQGIQDPNFGTLDQVARLNLSQFNLHRVQWNPGDEQFFSILDNHNLQLVDPCEMRTIDKFHFNMKTTWSEWNSNDKKLIAVCGSESQVRMVDIRSGSSVQTIVLGSVSRLASHRATRCLWSKQDINCLVVGDNEGYIHIYDTRHSTKPHLFVGQECGQISGMSFTMDNNSIITSQGTENKLIQWEYDKCSLRPLTFKFRKREVELSEEVAMEGVQQTSNGRSGSSMQRPLANNATDKTIPDQHIYCPVPSSVKKSKECYIYNLVSGYRIKTLKSDDILSQGVYSITGLLPESLVVYVGGRGRLRVWSLDEDYKRKKEAKMAKYHTTTWDSGDEL